MPQQQTAADDIRARAAASQAEGFAVPCYTTAEVGVHFSQNNSRRVQKFSQVRVTHWQRCITSRASRVTMGLNTLCHHQHPFVARHCHRIALAAFGTARFGAPLLRSWLRICCTFGDLQGCLTVLSLEPTRTVAAGAAKLGSLASELVFLKQGGGRVLTKRGLEVHSLLHAAWAPEGQMAPIVDITRFPDFAHASPKLYTLRAGDTL
jgi:hypothetical protein